MKIVARRNHELGYTTSVDVEIRIIDTPTSYGTTSIPLEMPRFTIQYRPSKRKKDRFQDYITGIRSYRVVIQSVKQLKKQYGEDHVRVIKQDYSLVVQPLEPVILKGLK